MSSVEFEEDITSKYRTQQFLRASDSPRLVSFLLKHHIVKTQKSAWRLLGVLIMGMFILSVYVLFANGIIGEHAVRPPAPVPRSIWEQLPKGVQKATPVSD